LIVLRGTMAGTEDFVEIERWARKKLDFLRRLSPFAQGIPSHDTLNDMMNALPAGLFSECFTNWVDNLSKRDADNVAIDGKTSRRARRGEGNPLHLDSAWASRQRLVLGQQAVDGCPKGTRSGKRNEITAIPRLLERLELTGALVTIDAIGCQRDIAEAIRAKGADYLLALRDNWPTLAEEVRLYFDREPASAFHTHKTIDGDRGRIKVRRHRVSHDVTWLSTDRRFPGEPRLPALAMVGMVEAEVERRGKTSIARRYYLSSAPLSAAQFARAVRAHWGIENRLLWVMDVVFQDDLMRLRTEHGPANMATIRHTALNLVRAIPDKASLKVRRKTVAWDDDYLFHTLTQPPPMTFNRFPYQRDPRIASAGRLSQHRC
jgi:predicted transposase YbfD/YdcC